MKELVGFLPDVYFFVCCFNPKNGKVLEEHVYAHEPNPKVVLGLAEKFSDVIVVAGLNSYSYYRLIRRRKGKTITDKITFLRSKHYDYL